MKWDIPDIALTAIGALVTVLYAVVLFSVLAATDADALSDPLGSVRVFQFTCTTSAQVIKPSSNPKGAKSLRLWNNSATPVYLGGADVTNGLTNGWPICTNTAACEQASFPIDSNPVVYCRAGSSVTIQAFWGY